MEKKCASCGSANPSKAAFCASCGRALEPKAAKKPATSAPNRKWRMPVALVATLLALAGVYFWLFIADDLKRDADTLITQTGDASTPGAQIFFAMTDTKLR